MLISDLKRYQLVYLGSPYTKYPTGIENAFVDIARITAKFVVEGVNVYSPICHTHPIAVYGNVDPKDHSIWLPFDEAMMNVCEALVVAKMESWSHSYGLAKEIDIFQKASKPVYYLNPDTMGLSW